jgi:5'-nucleotidase
MKLKLILVDMDGVLANFEEGFLIEWKNNYPELPYIPIQARRSFLSIVEGIYFKKGFVLGLEPFEGAIEALKTMRSEGHEVKICTTPLSGNKYSVEEKTAWVEKHLGKEWLKNLISIKDKSLVEGDYLIDDKPEITTTSIPKWEQIIFDAPYNRKVVGKKRLLKWADWQKVIK